MKVSFNEAKSVYPQGLDNQTESSESESILNSLEIAGNEYQRLLIANIFKPLKFQYPSIEADFLLLETQRKRENFLFFNAIPVIFLLITYYFDLIFTSQWLFPALLRFGVLLPCFLITYAIGKKTQTMRALHVFSFVMILLSSVGLIALSLMHTEPLRSAYLSGFFLVMLALSSLAKPHFRVMSIELLTVLFLLITCLLWVESLMFSAQFYLFIYILGAFMVLVNGFRTEKASRLEFISSRLLEIQSQELYLANKKTKSMFESINNLIFYLDSLGNIISFNDIVVNSLHFSHQALKKMNFVDLMTTGSVQDFKKILYDHVDGIEYSLKVNTNKPLPVLLNSRKVTFNGKTVGIVVSAQALTEIKAYQKKLEALAHYDYLTKLPNRFSFEENIDALIAYSKRHEKNFAVLYIDLDDFKRVNDTYGHDVGDAYLYQLARILKKNLREEDFIARTGGDEFAVLVRDIESKDSAGAIAEQILSALNKTLFVEGVSIQPAMSIGISLFPENGTTKKDLLKNSDIAMYEAKHRRKKRYYFFNS